MPGTGIRARVVLLVGYAVAGGLLGFALSSIPSLHSVTVFCVGNFSSPWPVLAFFAGRSQRSWIWAVCTGAVAEVACVFGFYGRFLSLDPGGLGRDPSSLASPLACPSWWSPCSGRCGMVTSRAHSSSGSARSRLGCWFWPGWLRPLAALSPARSALPERLAIGSTPPAGVAQAQGDSCMFPLPLTYHHQRDVGKVSTETVRSPRLHRDDAC